MTSLVVGRALVRDTLSIVHLGSHAMHGKPTCRPSGKCRPPGRLRQADGSFVRAFPAAARWGEPWPASVTEGDVSTFAPTLASYAAALREVAAGRRRVRIEGRWAAGRTGHTPRRRPDNAQRRGVALVGPGHYSLNRADARAVDRSVRSLSLDPAQAAHFSGLLHALLLALPRPVARASGRCGAIRRRAA